MGKRKFAEDDEDPQDQDHQDGQESDGDYVQSSRENDNGRATPRQLRVTLSRTRRTASGLRSRDNEEDQGESGDGAADTPSGNNTSAAPDQNAAQKKKVRIDFSNVPLSLLSYYLTSFASSILTSSAGAKASAPSRQNRTLWTRNRIQNDSNQG